MNRSVPVLRSRERRSRHGDESDRRRKGRHDPGLGRRQPRRPRHRPAGRALPASCRSRPPSATATAPSRSPTAPRRPRKLNKPEAGHFDKAGVEPGARLVELRLDDVERLQVGQEIDGRRARRRRAVDVTAVSKGKGFAGAMKRHNFNGQGACTAPQASPRSRLDRRLRHPGPGVQGHHDGRPHGRRAGHHAEPRGRGGRRRARPAARQGRRPRPQRRPRPHPRRREGSVHDDGQGRHQGRHGRQRRRRRARRRRLRRPAQRPGHAPGRHRPARRPPGRHAVAPRPAPRCAAAAPSRGKQKGTGRARQGSIRAPHWIGGGVALGPKPAATRSAPPRRWSASPCARPCPTAPPRARSSSRRWGFDAPQHQGRGGRARRARRRGQGARRAAARGRGRLEELPQPRSTSTSCDAGELNAYDVLVSTTGSCSPRRHAARRQRAVTGAAGRHAHRGRPRRPSR